MISFHPSRVTDTRKAKQGVIEMKTKTWTVTAVLNGGMVEYKKMNLVEANNAAAELEKDGASYIEFYREW